MLTDLPHVELPLPLKQAMREHGSAQNLNGWAYESLVAEAYRGGKIGLSALRRLLKLNFYEGEEFLANRDLYYQYDSSDLAMDRQTMRFLSKP